MISFLLRCQRGAVTFWDSRGPRDLSAAPLPDTLSKTGRAWDRALGVLLGLSFYASFLFPISKRDLFALGAIRICARTRLIANPCFCFLNEHLRHHSKAHKYQTTYTKG
jgi:hypothetical protein